MNLAVFDIDGTLLQSTAADDAAFAESMQQVLDIAVTDTDWTHYRHSTDSGLTHEIALAALHREPTEEEIAAVREEFCRRLLAGHAAAPGCLEAVAGAAAFLETLSTQPNWRVAIATGSWCATARLKTECAALDLGKFPMATADVSAERTEILAKAISDAREHYGCDFDRKIYIGDGVWDCLAAKSINIGFLGVGTGAKAERLRATGAREIIGDFTNPQRVMELIEHLAR